MTTFAYPVDMEQEAGEDVAVFCHDVPSAHSAGTTREEALANIAEALAVALMMLAETGQDFPVPSPAAGRPLARPGARDTAKILLAAALRRSGVRKGELATRLGIPASSVTRMLDLRHRTDIAELERALAALGWTLSVTAEAA